jgi:hypothetical protein
MTAVNGAQVMSWPPADGNAAYLDKTLRHIPVELGMAEGVGWRTLFAMWLRAFVASAVVGSFFFVLAAIISIASVGASASSGYGSSAAGAGAGFVVAVIGGFVSFFVFWFVLLLTKVTEPIAEWRVLLADRADRADSAYSHIFGVLWRRQFPVRWRVRRIHSASASISNRLVVFHGPYTAYVSVFAYGTSLYLGWTMWRARRGTALVAQFFADLVHSMAGHYDIEREMMRTEPVRAMREAVHAACREGLLCAAEGQWVPAEYGFPQGLPPLEESGFAEAPVPAVPQP